MKRINIEKLENNIEQIALYDLGKNNVFGCSYMVCQNGETVFKKHFGVSDWENRTPVDDNTLFRIGSMTKPIEMAKDRNGATGFTEDYTYDLTQNEELELAAHMLEVSLVFAKNKPKIQVHPLGIGGKSDPARLVFDSICGEGVAVSMIDMGNRFRLICAEITLVEQPKEMPNLPVARMMWKLKPDFKTGAAAWIYAGGAHHAVVSTALTVDDIRLFAKLTDTELVVIDNKTDLVSLEQQLKMLDIIAKN